MDVRKTLKEGELYFKSELNEPLFVTVWHSLSMR